MKEMVTRSVVKVKSLLEEQIGLEEPKHSTFFKQYSHQTKDEILKSATKEALIGNEDLGT